MVACSNRCLASVLFDSNQTQVAAAVGLPLQIRNPVIQHHHLVEMLPCICVLTLTERNLAQVAEAMDLPLPDPRPRRETSSTGQTASLHLPTRSRAIRPGRPGCTWNGPSPAHLRARRTTATPARSASVHPRPRSVGERSRQGCVCNGPPLPICGLVVQPTQIVSVHLCSMYSL